MEEGAARIGRAVRDLLAEAVPAQQALARRLGIGVTDAQALQHLAASAHETGTVELGQLLGIRSASAAALVDRLETAGHVRRHPHPSDRRRVSLQVTDTAQAEVIAELAPLLTGIASLVRGLSAEEANTVATFLDGTIDLLRGLSGTR
ncbi:MarR family winged helix-turn-helix transcriptional regulator [Amycolatopsis sp. cg5]|uniref:MarR family winged helix-turn-helix transcriptional regulator n=1 Tax=Amycolatopsis sp. cg5 TaxID=3238802 RepID=UPI0035235E16